MAESNTNQQFKDTLAECRDIFARKLHDYSASWRILRPTSLTDQLFIKARRIRDIETMGTSMIDEGIRPEFIALVNYGIIGLIQLSHPAALVPDMSADEALALYDGIAQNAFELMTKKNHDYGEVWREMRVSSYTDFILTKIARIKQLEDLDGKSLVSEGIDSNLLDIINYAVFGAIRLK